ncbi:MAG TPA: hypothetical protein VE219_02025, partial [Candidatus Sulfotelmatobacter sp.]|nr:hypothetical protein [Candidatus Sulfotelmatobacter sp.]
TASGWFSDRTIRYLASGKPAIVQDTGFSETYPVGEGLLAFRTCTEAASALRRVRADYEHHRRAARKVAEELFDSRRVLSHVLDLAVVATPA